MSQKKKRFQNGLKKVIIFINYIDMDILGIIIICIVLYFGFQFATKGHISFDVGNMNWLGIIIHSVFVGAMLDKIYNKYYYVYHYF